MLAVAAILPQSLIQPQEMTFESSCEMARLRGWRRSCQDTTVLLRNVESPSQDLDGVRQISLDEQRHSSIVQIGKFFHESHCVKCRMIVEVERKVATADYCGDIQSGEFALCGLEAKSIQG